VSASTHGDSQEIRRWHTSPTGNLRASDIGYHYVVLNGFRRKGFYKPNDDGVVETGRPETVKGAHCKAMGMNSATLGVCCVGNPGWMTAGPSYLPPGMVGRVVNRPYMTVEQHKALVALLARLCVEHDLDPTGTFAHNGRVCHVISQHSDHEPGKPLCASVNLPVLRNQVRRAINGR
jgi:hypothetical protein